MQNKLLLLRKVCITFLLITFFCIFNKNVKAASFSYGSFDWDNFIKQHPNYWTDTCYSDDEDCKDEVLVTKKKFYIRLYSLLAEYQKKGYTINDNVIIETVFFGLTPDTFKDDSDVYNIEEEEKVNDTYKYIASDDENPESAKSYFEQETDSLKTLLNNTVGYKQKCYGFTNGTVSQDANGIPVCSDGSTPYGDKCTNVLDGTLKATFWDKLGINNIFSESENQKKCREIATESGYSDFELGKTTDKQEYDLDFYWKFLKESDYLDKKPQLQSYYAAVLNKAKKKSMTDPAWGTTKSEQDEEKLKYKDEIEESRQYIIDLIKDILTKYEEIYGTPISMQNTTSTSYWWPIGSDETTQDGDIIMAAGDPASINITSNFGLRIKPKIGMHSGIDISGTTGFTNIIAVRDGVVVYSSLSQGINCPNSTSVDDDCGGGYGNYIILQHGDGNYTLYAHMQEGTLTLKEGESVKQGQVIGKMGSSGSSTGSHLHFEIRLGSNNRQNAVDPLTYISSENPRKSGASDDLINFIHNFEGTPKESNGLYVVFDDGFGNPTVGWGVVPKYNVEAFAELGINVSSLSVGSTVSKEIVDTIESQEIQKWRDNITSSLSNAGISLNEKQIDALVSRAYNAGYSASKFINAYTSYGDTDALYDNYMSKPITSKGKVARGLIKRREKEWKLFHEGIYS